MVRRHISDDVKEMAFSMSLKGMSDSNIRQLTGVSERSLKRLRSTYRKTGYVSVKPFATGRPRLLTSMEVKFLCDCVERQPDMSLTELQTELREVCAVKTSLQTITRTLQREGYTMKTITRPALGRNELGEKGRVGRKVKINDTGCDNEGNLRSDSDDVGCEDRNMVAQA